jgi:3-hydroxy-3-methylglutaryl CoA synthase
MAVAAGLDCLSDYPREKVGGLSLSSTTMPYLERQNAAICAGALALGAGIRTADFGASLKSGTTALLYACDVLKAGEVESFLVCAADCRQGKPGSSPEHTFGDGAAALLVGRDDVIAELEGSYSLTRDFADFRRTQEDRFIRSWEERWVRDEGYGKIIPEAVAGFLSKYGRKIGEFTKIVISCPAAPALKGVCKGLGIAPEQLQDNLVNSVGDTGSALSLMMLVAALEQARPGDRILVVGYGSGSDVLAFRVTEAIEKARGGVGIKGHLRKKADLDSYTKYLVFRDLLPVDIGIRGEESPQLRFSLMFREGKTLAALCGSRCTACGTPQYPSRRVCINPECGAVDQMEDYYFYDKTGRVKSFTGDSLAFSFSPPAIYGLIDFEDGGRLYLDITDCDLTSLAVGTPMRMSLRRRYADKRRGIYAYFWKAVPATD